jgi:lysozyme
MKVAIDQLQILRARLTRTEGRRNRPYVDTVGKLTIGIGHNLTDKGISDSIVDALFVEDISQAERDAKTLVAYEKIDPIRQTVLIDMVFNIGIDKLREFKNTLSYIARGAFEEAADEMLRSEWAKQVGNRAIELSRIIRTGIIQGVNS